MKIFKIAAIAALCFTSFFANAAATTTSETGKARCRPSSSTPYFDTYTDTCVAQCHEYQKTDYTTNTCIKHSCTNPSYYFRASNGSCVATQADCTQGDSVLVSTELEKAKYGERFCRPYTATEIRKNKCGQGPTPAEQGAWDETQNKCICVQYSTLKGDQCKLNSWLCTRGLNGVSLESGNSWNDATKTCTCKPGTMFNTTTNMCQCTADKVLNKNTYKCQCRSGKTLDSATNMCK